jgi:hypothetical protein
VRLFGRISSGCPPVYAIGAADLDNRESSRDSVSAQNSDTIDLWRAHGSPIRFSPSVYSTTQKRDSNAPEGWVSADVSANRELRMIEFSDVAQWHEGSSGAPFPLARVGVQIIVGSNLNRSWQACGKNHMTGALVTTWTGSDHAWRRASRAWDWTTLSSHLPRFLRDCHEVSQATIACVTTEGKRYQELLRVAADLL